jgi:hypothetical protein
VTGASPSFGHVELKSSTALKEAIFLLNGKRMRNQTIRAKEDPAFA